MKKFLVIACLLVVVLMVILLRTDNTALSKEDTSYYVVYSSMLRRSSSIVGIDDSGVPTFIKRLTLQDISKCDYVNGVCIAGGSRANNHFIIDKNGEVEEFYLLDNPNYSGVTTITMDESNIYAVMNGNLTDNTYQNLLVIQTADGNTIEKRIIDIYARDILFNENILYIVGGYLNVEQDVWSCKIIRYDLQTGIFTERTDTPGKQYMSCQIYEGNLLCTVADMQGDIFQIDILDCVTMQKNKDITFLNPVYNIAANDDVILIVFENSISILDLQKNKLFAKVSLPDGTYVTQAVLTPNHLYLLSRNNEKKYSEKSVHLGYISNLNLETFSLISTPLITSEEYHDSIIFFPMHQTQ